MNIKQLKLARQSKCPKCESCETTYDNLVIDSGYIEQSGSCGKCLYAWTEQYILSDIIAAEVTE